jgi:uncharacterized membrane protein
MVVNFVPLVFLGAFLSGTSALCIEAYAKNKNSFFFIFSFILEFFLIFTYLHLFSKGKNNSVIYLILKLVSILYVLVFNFLLFHILLTPKQMLGIFFSFVAIVLLKEK